MSLDYIVCGMPRSRTAWMSVFLSDDKLCLHEGINGCYSMSEYFSKFRGSINGDSTTASSIIDANSMACKKIIILRDPGISKDSSKNIADADIEYFNNEYAYIDSMDGLRIRFDDIDDRLSEIWEYVKSDPFDSVRADNLKNLNIAVNLPYQFDIEAWRSLYAEVV